MRCSGIVISRSRLRFDLIGTQAGLAEKAITHRIGESSDVPGCLENILVRQDRSIKTEDIFPLLHILAPPVFLEIAFQLCSKGTVVPAAIEAPVDLCGLEDKAASLAETYDLLHQGGIFLGDCVTHCWEIRLFVVGGGQNSRQPLSARGNWCHLTSPHLIHRGKQLPRKPLGISLDQTQIMRKLPARRLEPLWIDLPSINTELHDGKSL